MRLMKLIPPRLTRADDAGAFEASVADKAHVTDEAVASDVGIEADAVDEADVAAVDLADDADAIDEVGAADDSIMIDKVVLGMLTLFVPFSLTNIPQSSQK